MLQYGVMEILPLLWYGVILIDQLVIINFCFFKNYQIEFSTDHTGLPGKVQFQWNADIMHNAKGE